MAEILSTLSSDGLAGTPTNGGGRFVSPIAWNADQAQDLTAGGNTAVLECYKGTTIENGWDADGTLRLTSDFQLTGWTSAVGTGLTIRAAAGNANDGVVGAGFKLTSTSAITMYSELTTLDAWYVEGLELSTENSGGLSFYQRYGDVTVVDSCIIRNVTSAAVGNLYLRSTEDFTISNCLLIALPGSSSSSANVEFRSVPATDFSIIGSTLIHYTAFNIGYNSGLDWAMTIKSSAFYNADVWSETSNPQNGSTIQNNAFSNASIPEPDTASQFNLSINDATDFVSPTTENYNAEVGGILEDNGLYDALYPTDIAGTTRSDPPEIGAYEIAGAPTVSFDGPNIVAQTGTEDVLFSFDENGEGTVASRFTGATTYALAPTSDPLQTGLTVNPTTGNIEGTPTEVATRNIIIEGSD